jgi:hypothetical protein
MRDMIWDKPKSLSQLLKEQGTSCSFEGCSNPKSGFKGPGQDMCRDHQLKLIEYGGMGRKDRPHTFHRTWVCSKCGWDAWNDPIYKGLTDEQKSTAIRIVMHGHHITRQADGGKHSEENVEGLCDRCHAIETTIHRHFLK